MEVEGPLGPLPYPTKNANFLYFFGIDSLLECFVPSDSMWTLMIII
jgi:hypothetical protein